MKTVAIARRYARALLLIAKENNKADNYRLELDRIVALFENESLVHQAICNPLYDVCGRRRLLTVIVDKLNLSQVVGSFLILLFDKGRFGFLQAIVDHYHRLADDLKGVARATVVSATELSQDALDKIKTALMRRTGKSIELDIQTDPTLIGGVVTQLGDLVLDGSIKTQLLNMRESLKRGESA